MYEAVTGRPPFTGDNPVAIAYKQVHDAPDAAERRSSPTLPRGFEAIVTEAAGQEPGEPLLVGRRAASPTCKRYRDGMSTAAESLPRPPRAGALAGAAAAGGDDATVVVPPTRASGQPTPRARRSCAATQMATSAGAAPGRPSARPPRPVYRRTEYTDVAAGEPPGWLVAAVIGIVALLVVGGLVAYNLTRDDTPRSPPSPCPTSSARRRPTPSGCCSDAGLVRQVPCPRSRPPWPRAPSSARTRRPVRPSTRARTSPRRQLGHHAGVAAATSSGRTEPQARAALAALGLPEPG